MTSADIAAKSHEEHDNVNVDLTASVVAYRTTEHAC
jgi:hypothetical protein